MHILSKICVTRKETTIDKSNASFFQNTLQIKINTKYKTHIWKQQLLPQNGSREGRVYAYLKPYRPLEIVR